MTSAPGGGVVLVAGPGPAGRLTSRVREVLALLERRGGTTDADPLAAAVGLDGPVDPPEDPALARLLPAGYRDDDAAAAEFRRFTETDLLRSKREHAEAVLADAAPLPGLVHLDAKALPAWLGTVNDVRLILGTRLGLKDDDQDPAQGIDPGDPRWPDLEDYYWLTDFQDRLVESMTAHLPEVRSDPMDEQELADLQAEIARRAERRDRDED